MGTRNILIIIGLLFFLISLGTFAYLLTYGKKNVGSNQPAGNQSVSDSGVASEPKQVNTPVPIVQDVKNPALTNLVSQSSENTLTITVFEDKNGDGKKDPSEVNFDQDVEVAYGIPGKTSNARTGTTGQVIFGNVGEGVFTVYLFNPPAGFTATTPTTVSDVKIPPSASVKFGLKSVSQ